MMCQLTAKTIHVSELLTEQTLECKTKFLKLWSIKSSQLQTSNV